jgi:tRNA dimethylallyltransferase
MHKQPLLIVLGPTASGKTRLAVHLAAALEGEIISADSRQVFKGMDIGTGKDLADYKVEGKTISHHLIDICNAGERYQVNRFKEDFYKALNEIATRAKLPILCGGTGMYIHSILQNHILTSIPVNDELRSELLNLEIAVLQHRLSEYPESLTQHADRSTRKRLIRAIEIADHLNNSKWIVPPARPALKPFVIGLMEDVVFRRQKIYDRLERRFEQGLIEEVERLLSEGVPREMLTFYGLEYKMVAAYLNHKMNLQELKSRLFIGICQYAKRQMTFFRKMEKDGVVIHWYDANLPLTTLLTITINDYQAHLIGSKESSV